MFAVFFTSLIEFIEFFSCVICDSNNDLFSCKPASSDSISGSLESICPILLVFVANLLFACSDCCSVVFS